MNTPLSKVVEEFVKHSPAAWAHMCEYHRAQAAGRLVGYLFALILFILFCRRTVPLMFRWSASELVDEHAPAPLLLLLVMSMGTALSIWGACEMPQAWGALFAPERDAAIDVLRMGR